MMETILAAFANGALACLPLVAAVWILLRFAAQRLNAATRYTVWWIVMAITILAPLRYMPRRSAPAVAPAAVKAPAPDSPIMPEAIPISASAPLIVVPRAVVNRDTDWRALIAIWPVTSALLLMRLLYSLALLHRRRTRAAVAAGPLREVADRCLDRCGVRRKIRVGISDDTVSPMVTGPFPPAILIPSAFVRALSDREMELVCLHEAAHLARYDDAALLLQRLIQAVFVWNPLVHWIGRRMDLEREIACDDLVVAIADGAGAYASCLTRVAELSGAYRPSPLAAAATEGRSHLAARIESLLDRSRRSGAGLLKGRFAALALGLAAIAIPAARAPAVLAFAAEHTASAPAPTLIAQAREVQPAQPTAPARRPAQPETAAVPRTVRLFVSVTDPENRYVTGLGQSDFHVFQRGIEQRISSFNAEEEPVAIWIVWNVSDNSRLSPDSKDLQNQLAALQNRMEGLLQIYAPTHPEVRVLQAQIEEIRQRFVRSASPETIASLLSQRNAQDSFTVVRVQAEALRKAGNDIGSSAIRRKAVVVVSDGGGQPDLIRPGSEFFNAVVAARAPVFPIHVGGPAETVSAQALALPAAERSPDAADAQALGTAINRLAIAVRNQYVLECLSTQSGTAPALDVKLSQMRGLPPLTARIRAVYPAPRVP